MFGSSLVRLPRPALRAASCQLTRCTSTLHRTTRANYDRTFEASLHPSGEFWLAAAKEQLTWFEEPTVALDTSHAPFNRWFPDGKINLCYNALDRHVATIGDRTALAYHSTVGGHSRNISYRALLDDVISFAGSLCEMGVGAGDRVLLYMPMVPEAAVAILACTRIGAVHSIVFGGFAANELAVRIDDASPKVIIAATCGLEAGKGALPYMPAVNQAIEIARAEVPHVVVLRRDEPAAAEVEYALDPQRDHDFAECVASGSRAAECVPLPTQAPLYTIYTSGTTGDPKGILREHSHVAMLKWTMGESTAQRSTA
jgi:propionyl-CoA synthetase